nr:MAG TPA: hypothetical protein [Caudoviricetes sp.]
MKSSEEILPAHYLRGRHDRRPRHLRRHQLVLVGR